LPLYDRYAPPSDNVSRPVPQSPVVSMVLTRLDHGSGTLAGLPRHLMDRLQSVINAASRLVFSARKYDNITPLLRELHRVKLSGANSIPYDGACLSMPAQFSSVVSFGLNSPCVWRLLWTTAAISIDGSSNRSSLEAQHDRRPSFSHCRGESMERLAGRRHIYTVTTVLQTETEN